MPAELAIPTLGIFIDGWNTIIVTQVFEWAFSWFLPPHPRNDPSCL